MKIIFLNNWILQSTVLCFLICFFSCKNSESKDRLLNYNDSSNHKTILFTSKKDSIPKGTNLKKLATENDSLLKHPIGEPSPKYNPYYHLSKDLIDNNVYYADTIIVRTTEELIKNLKNNRLIQLIENEYNLDSLLLIKQIKNLKIVGTGASKLLLNNKNGTVLMLVNSHNIHLEGLIIGRPENLAFNEEQGVLRIDYAYNINISNCKIYGPGTIGLRTYGVYDLVFSDSEITGCGILIFHIARCRAFKFVHSKFHDNFLVTSVLGGFTNASREISFLDCAFLDNKPEMPGNPAFNQSDIYESVLFTNSVFKNNKGFKWYKDRVRLINCQIDADDFINFPENKN